MLSSVVQTDKFLSLNETAEKLGVSVDTLLEWNSSNILKPTITQSGEIGYTESQVEKFLSIQQFLISGKGNTPAEDFVQPKTQLPLNSGWNIKTDNSLPHSNNLSTKPRKKNGLYPLLAISLTSVLIILISALLIQKSVFKTESYEKGLSASESTGADQKPASGLSGANLFESTFFPIGVPIKNQNLGNGNNLSDGSYNLSDNGLAVQIPVFTKISSGSQGSNSIESSIVPVLGFSVNGVSYASRPNYPVNQKGEISVFDDSGNIKGETKDPNLLSAALGTTAGLWNGVPAKRSISQNLLTAFVALTLLSSLLIFFTKQPSYSGNLPGSSYSDALSFTPNAGRVIEIWQKTDGTVVLNLMGKECKVSKPELDSESDQFIERLLGFAKETEKEVDYDILKDTEIKFYAPLSKLVTRLGFVGLKREMFFPRTSKTRVLFRKYLTQEDLASMGLTLDQVSEALKN